MKITLGEIRVDKKVTIERSEALMYSEWDFFFMSKLLRSIKRKISLREGLGENNINLSLA